MGRWYVIDAMAEAYYSTSPYSYVRNNPISRIDILGLWDDDYGDYDDRYVRDEDGDGRGDEGAEPEWYLTWTGHKDGFVSEFEMGEDEWGEYTDPIDDQDIENVDIEGDRIEPEWDDMMDAFREGVERFQEAFEDLEETNRENDKRQKRNARDAKKTQEKLIDVTNKLVESRRKNKEVQDKIESPTFWIQVTGYTIFNIVTFPVFGPARINFEPGVIIDPNYGYPDYGPYRL